MKLNLNNAKKILPMKNLHKCSWKKKKLKSFETAL